MAAELMEPLRSSVFCKNKPYVVVHTYQTSYSFSSYSIGDASVVVVVGGDSRMLVVMLQEIKLLLLIRQKIFCFLPPCRLQSCQWRPVRTNSLSHDSTMRNNYSSSPRGGWCRRWNGRSLRCWSPLFSDSSNSRISRLRSCPIL